MMSTGHRSLEKSTQRNENNSIGLGAMITIDGKSGAPCFELNGSYRASGWAFCE